MELELARAKKDSYFWIFLVLAKLEEKRGVVAALIRYVFRGGIDSRDVEEVF